jgi:AraC-like DNA-binding protein
MLRYLSGGVRRFGTMPIGPHSRLNWEFYAVVKGRCGVLLESGEKLPLRANCLWVFPPHHVREQPGMEEVAAAVHVSSSHLRRLFVTVRHQSPRAVLVNAQIEIAMRLLAGSDLKIESVAAEAGFTSARDFSRVFSARKGCSPSEWRRKVQPPYVEPASKRKIASQ